MTKLLQNAIETVRQLAPESQDEIARAMLRTSPQPKALQKQSILRTCPQFSKD